MPKDSRYTLGAKIDTHFVETLEEIHIAIYLSKTEKISHIQKAIMSLGGATFFLQVAWEIKALDTKKYILISEKLNEIGRMLGGWLRQLQGNPRS